MLAEKKLSGVKTIILRAPRFKVHVGDKTECITISCELLEYSNECLL